MTSNRAISTRSLQQLVASAIKHSAVEVSFAIGQEKSSGKTGATLRFRLADNRSSELEIPTTSVELATEILQRVRLFPALAPTKVRSGLLRTEFSSLVSDCEATFYRHGPKDALSKIVLSNFLVDAPDRAGFWLGFDDADGEKLKNLLQTNNGVIFVWDENINGRANALAALKSACPEAETIPLVEAIADDLTFLERAKSKWVFAGVGGKDPFFLLQALQSFSLAKREVIRGVVFQSEMKRNCISCREEIGEPRDELVKSIVKPGTKVIIGHGCALCDDKGWIGDFSVASLIAFEGEVKKLFLTDASLPDLLEQIKLEGFYLPYEYAVRSLTLGECTEEVLTRSLSRPPKNYRLRVPRIDRDVESDAASVTETGRFVISNEFFSTSTPNDAPIRGADVFAAMKRDSQPDLPAIERASQGRILVIDDDPDQRAILGKVFEMAGYSVSAAADGIDGIMTATQQNPSVILVDLMMPDIDGRETIRRLRQNNSTKHVPIIALTAYPDPEVEYELLDAGADDFCPKSVSKKVLLKRIEKVTGRAIR